MGLDISAYTNLRKIDCLFNSDGEPVDRQTGERIENYVQPYANPDFDADRWEGLEDRAVYSYDSYDHVMSRGYGGYGRWRNMLAKLAGYPETPYESFGMEGKSHAAARWDPDGEKGPFSELINFADNEGDLGPVVCAKLAKDFAEFDERASKVQEDCFYRDYKAMREALERVAGNGLLHFH